MDENVLARLYEPFNQGAQNIDRAKGGLGLGLALVRGLAELHGGSVSAESAGPGKGSTFTVRLPLAVVSEDGSAPAPDSTASPVKTDLRILIIDDNRDSAESLKLFLSFLGHEAAVEFDGRAGVRRARDLRPHILISDLGLPGELDGYAVAKAVRADPDLSHVYLIALSGYGLETHQQRTREVGFHQHLVKPVNLSELERTLASIASR
jgi:CheY-like chemotaxis protein